MDKFVLTIGIRLVIGFLATFISVILWSRTRDIPWIFIVLGVFSIFVSDLVEIALAFGFNIYYDYTIAGIQIMPLVLHVLPNVFFILAMGIFLIRDRKY